MQYIIEYEEDLTIEEIFEMYDEEYAREILRHYKNRYQED